MFGIQEFKSSGENLKLLILSMTNNIIIIFL